LLDVQLYVTVTFELKKNTSHIKQSISSQGTKTGHTSHIKQSISSQGTKTGH